MRTGLIRTAAAIVLASTAAQADGTAGNICTGAGYHAGTDAFQSCVAQVSGDDPMARLEAGAWDAVPIDGDRAEPGLTPLSALERGKAGPPVTAVRLPDGGAALPSFGGGHLNGAPLPGAPTPSAPSAPPPPAQGGGFPGPVPPTPPTLPDTSFVTGMLGR